MDLDSTVHSNIANGYVMKSMLTTIYKTHDDELGWGFGVVGGGVAVTSGAHAAAAAAAAVAAGGVCGGGLL